MFLCLASRSQARRAFASAVATLLGLRNTPTTGTPSMAVTRSQSATPVARAGHSATKDFFATAASSPSRPVRASHLTTLVSRRRVASGEYLGSASYPSEGARRETPSRSSRSGESSRESSRESVVISAGLTDSDADAPTVPTFLAF